MNANGNVPRGVATGVGTRDRHLMQEIRLHATCNNCLYSQDITYGKFDSISDGYNDVRAHAQNRKHHVRVYCIMNGERFGKYDIDYHSESFEGKLVNWFKRHKKALISLASLHGCMLFI